ncbi:MAG: membrane protein insertase YidC [Victivallaceae bacterium]|nr:membrane protein insertase YidC [Victivallaceae bacterium]
MKFDKETIIIFSLCLVFILAWNPLCRYMGWISEAAPAHSAPVRENVPPKPLPPEPLPALTPAKTVSLPEKSAPKKLSILPEQKIDGSLSAFTFDPNQGVLQRVSFLKYFEEDRKTPIKFRSNLPPGALAVSGESAWRVEEIVDNSIDRTAKSYQLVRKMTDDTGKRFTLTQRWRISGGYILAYSFSIKNTGKSALKFPTLAVMGVGLPPFSVMTNDRNVNQETNSIDYCTENGVLENIATDAKDKDFFAAVPGRFHWCGGSNKYFATLLAAERPFDALIPRRQLFPETADRTKYYLAAVGGVYRDIIVAAGKEKTFGFRCYNGPKTIDQLAEFDAKAPEIMNLSWGGPMDWIAEKLLSFLIFLKGICGSYGWSIIIITVIVRLLFWPITQKANKSMKRMQKLQPQMKEIREKYKNDPQTMNAKVMELYRREKVNPLGGCLPILLQIPVFIALYSTLNGAVELRQVSFWWIQDLAKPDTVATVFGLAINPLIIVMTALMVLQQHLTPAAMDPMQQKMMMLMPVMMLFMLYNLPAGLTLYWTVSQILAIIQLVLQKQIDSGEKNKPIKQAA